MVAAMTDILTIRFLAACKNGNLDSAKRNVDSAEINTKGEGNNTGLMLASAGGKEEVVKFLLTLDDIDVNVTNSDGRSALMLAANKRHGNIVKMLVQREDTNIELEDTWKMTAEALANIRNYTDIATLIKEAKKRRDDNFFRVYEDLQPEEDILEPVENIPVYADVRKIKTGPVENKNEVNNEEAIIAIGENSKTENHDLIDLDTEVKSNVKNRHKYDNLDLITVPISSKRASRSSRGAIRPVSMSLDLITGPGITRRENPSTNRKKSRCTSITPDMIPESSTNFETNKLDSMTVDMNAGSSNNNEESGPDTMTLDIISGSNTSTVAESRSRPNSPQFVPSLAELCSPVAELARPQHDDEPIIGKWLIRVLSEEEGKIHSEKSHEEVETKKKPHKEKQKSLKNDLEIKEISMDAINEDLSSKTRENILKKIEEVNLLMVKAEKEYVPSKVVEMKQKKEIANCMAVANTERKQLYSRQANEKKQFERKQKLEKNELFANQKSNIDKIKENFKIEIEEAKMQEKKITQYQDMIGALVEKLSQLENQAVSEQSKTKLNKSGGSRSELECPVCLEEMRPPVRIWQCKDGHALCDNCKQNPRIKKCPTCRGPFMGRATILEKVAQSIFNTEGI